MSIINQETYQQMKNSYAACSSWAVWDFPEDGSHTYDLNGKGYKLNTIVQTLNEDLTNEQIAELGLHNDVVIVALNFGARDETADPAFAGINKLLNDVAFFNFHEELDIHRYSGDSRQKKAYVDTRLWGSYMTDHVKYNVSGVLEPVADSDSNSDNLTNLLKNKEFMQIQVDGLIAELKTLGCSNPIIIAVGGKAYNGLNKKYIRTQLENQLGEDTQIIKVDHYSRSNAISDDKYVEKVQLAIDTIQ